MAWGAGTVFPLGSAFPCVAKAIEHPAVVAAEEQVPEITEATRRWVCGG
ncbi:MAG TPA: hypothetical protein VE733_31335 [Streptosporangiaceae bacterium]|jgi:hypothetical protein|nr:hypothetical protein [Streptosporangiaceae bacterium]